MDDLSGFCVCPYLILILCALFSLFLANRPVWAFVLTLSHLNHWSLFFTFSLLHHALSDRACTIHFVLTLLIFGTVTSVLFPFSFYSFICPFSLFSVISVHCPSGTFFCLQVPFCHYASFPSEFCGWWCFCHHTIE